MVYIAWFCSLRELLSIHLVCSLQTTNDAIRMAFHYSSEHSVKACYESIIIMLDNVVNIYPFHSD